MYLTYTGILFLTTSERISFCQTIVQLSSLHRDKRQKTFLFSLASQNVSPIRPAKDFVGGGGVINDYSLIDLDRYTILGQYYTYHLDFVAHRIKRMFKSCIGIQTAFSAMMFYIFYRSHNTPLSKIS